MAARWPEIGPAAEQNASPVWSPSLGPQPGRQGLGAPPAWDRLAFPGKEEWKLLHKHSFIQQTLLAPPLCPGQVGMGHREELSRSLAMGAPPGSL